MNTMMTEIVWPLFGRVGTFVAGALVASGVATEYADHIGLGLGAAGFVALDLVVRRLRSK